MIQTYSNTGAQKLNSHHMLQKPKKYRPPSLIWESVEMAWHFFYQSKGYLLPMSYVHLLLRYPDMCIELEEKLLIDSFILQSFKCDQS